LSKDNGNAIFGDEFLAIFKFNMLANFVLTKIKLFTFGISPYLCTLKFLLLYDL